MAALAEMARDGVRVRVIYDWLGSFGVSRRLWQSLLDAGGEVRCFNRPRLASPLGWLARDHRKMLSVDGSIAFVTGLCLSRKWLGEPERGIPPWRDTGVELRGPGVAAIEQAFAQMWGLAGAPLEGMDPAQPRAVARPGDVALRVIPAEPNIARLIRLDQLIAVTATRTLWLTDAYFLGAASYVQALRAAALDGVDVRLLVPGTSDLKLLSSVSRAGYRPLLEAGVRVFERNGSMLHAKAAVADGRWSRIGSSNLNLASWIGNYELDVAIEDRAFARAMEQMYEHDLANATEIVLDTRGRVCSAGRQAGACGADASAGSATRSTAAVLRLCNAVGAAIAGRRSLGAAESNIVLYGGVALLSLTIVGLWWPYLIALPLGLLGLCMPSRCSFMRASCALPREEGRNRHRPRAGALL